MTLQTKTPLKRGTPLRKKSKKHAKKREDEKPYETWLYVWGQCVVTGQPVFDLAHTGDYRHGKGMGCKAAPDTLLPLIRPLHAIAESNDRNFWPTVGLPDYLKIANDLHKCFLRGGNPIDIFEAAQRRVDQGYVRTLLGEISF